MGTTRASAGLLLALLFVPARAQEPVTVSVVLNRPWTDTGLFLNQGQVVTVNAQGTMNWYTGACGGRCLSTPAGIPCPGRTPKRFGLTCLSLIAKINPNGQPFYAGNSVEFTANAGGELFLGVNDDNFADNTGTWTATITSRTAFGHAPRPPAGPPPSISSAGSTCNDGGHAPASSERALEIGKQAALGRRDAVAFSCFLLAANQGNASAQIDVGYAYEKGIAVAADPAEALRWYLAAANQGNTTAQFNLTQFYAKGTAGAADRPEADRWSKKMWELRDQHSHVCSSFPVKETMARVELKSTRDGAGVLLGLFAQAVTGVKVDMKDAVPELVVSQGSDQLQSYGRFHIDMGMQSGDFLCQGVFLRGHPKYCDDDDPAKKGPRLCTADDAGLDTKLTEAAARKLLDRVPSFNEVFRLRPLNDGRYQVTLAPTSVQLAGTYTGVTE